MNDRRAQAWKCQVCGYIHQAAEAPEWCPVCGAERILFVEAAAVAATAKDKGARVWRCLACGTLHEGDHPPENCPVCGVPAETFESSERAESACCAGSARRIVILGASIAGICAAEAAREVSPNAPILVLSKEKHLPYYRLNLTRYLAGEVTREGLLLHPASWYAERGIELVLDAEVTAIQPERGQVALRDGREFPYDSLVLAIGAHPFIPPIPGATREGVFSVRTLDDADALLGALRPDLGCVCIGGGLLGLETAGALARRGVRVTVVEGFPWLLPRQLSQRAAQLVERALESLQISVRLNARVKEIAGDDRVREVLLEDGTRLPADLAVVTAGVRSNSYLARLAQLKVKQGVLVDDFLATSDSRIFAAGDVAEHGGVVYGIWAPAQYQGKIAGMNATGMRSAFGGIPSSNTIKVLGIDLFSIGIFEPGDGSFLVVEEGQDEGYLRFVFHDNRLVGGILIGHEHHRLAPSLKRAVEEKSDFSGLLKGRPDARAVAAHIAR